MERDEAFLAALAEYPHHSALEIEVEGLEFDEFGNAHARGVQQFQHGPVPEAELAGGVRRVEEPGDFLLREHVRQEGREFRRINERGGIGGKGAPVHAPGEKAAQGGYPPRKRTRRVAPLTQPGDEQRDVLVVKAGERRPQFVQKIAERIQVLPVGRDGIARQSPFGYESVKPAGSQPRRKTAGRVGGPSHFRRCGWRLGSRGCVHVGRIHQTMRNRKPVTSFGAVE